MGRNARQWHNSTSPMDLVWAALLNSLLHAPHESTVTMHGQGGLDGHLGGLALPLGLPRPGTLSGPLHSRHSLALIRLIIFCWMSLRSSSRGILVNTIGHIHSGGLGYNTRLLGSITACCWAFAGHRFILNKNGIRRRSSKNAFGRSQIKA